MQARITLAAIAIAALAVGPAFAQDEHAGHTMPAAQTPAPGTRNPNLPPDNEASKDQLAKSPRHGEWVDIKRESGPAIKSFVVYPERASKAPVVIVIHEIFGMTDWVRGVADQLAKEGFIAIAPDFLSGRGPNGGGSESLGAQLGQEIGKVTVADKTALLDAVMEYGRKLPASNGKTATIGFCWGGSTSFGYAAAQPNLNAAVVYYGTAPNDPSAPQGSFLPAPSLANIKAPVLGLYGGTDARIGGTIPATEARMKELGKTYQPNTFEGAGHGFLRQQSGQNGANMKATEQAWPKTIGFLRMHTDGTPRPTSPQAAAMPAARNPNLPPDNDAAKEQLAKSPRRNESVDVKMASGPAINSFVIYPERKDKAPVVIVVHDIGGMSDWARGIGDQLAKEGFIAIVPDLLSGKGPNGGGTASLGDQVGATIRTLTSDELKSKLDALMAYGKTLPSSNGKTGTIGFCWGGGTVFNYALNQPLVNATASYYGPMPTDPAAYEKAKAPILGLYGGNDNRVNANIPTAEAELKKHAATYSPNIFAGAGHGFLRNQSGSDGANLKATEQAWPKTLEFLRMYTEPGKGGTGK